MNLLKSTKLIQYLTIVYDALYALFKHIGNFGGAILSLNAKCIIGKLPFVLFIVGISAYSIVQVNIFLLGIEANILQDFRCLSGLFCI